MMLRLPAPFRPADHDVGARTRRRLAALGLEAQRLEPAVEKRGHFREAIDVGAAGLDQHEALQRVDHGGLGFGGGFKQLGIGCGMGPPCGKSKSEGEGCWELGQRSVAHLPC
jgi:hypothetical protein